MPLKGCTVSCSSRLLLIPLNAATTYHEKEGEYGGLMSAATLANAGEISDYSPRSVIAAWS